MEIVEVTWGRAVRVWWSYLWRNLVAILGASILGFVIGFGFHFVIAMAGGDVDASRPFIVALNVAIGLAVSVIPVKMILNKDYGRFRLVLIAKNPD